jgi:hypothetical protein
MHSQSGLIVTLEIITFNARWHFLSAAACEHRKQFTDVSTVTLPTDAEQDALAKFSISKKSTLLSTSTNPISS